MNAVWTPAGTGRMGNFLHDLRYGLRMLRRHPGFAFVVILTLGLGIGANTAIFSVVNGVLFRPLPYENPDQLVLLRHHIESNGFADAPLPPADVIDIREGTDSFHGVAATDRTVEQNLTGDGEPEEVRVAGVTANLFEVLGVDAHLGRTFVPEDEIPFPQRPRPGTTPVNNVLISHDLWVRRFGSDPQIVGRQLVLNGFANTIVGVLPRTFELLMPANAGMPTDIDVWTTPRFDFRNAPRNSANANRRVIARLKAGVSREQAQEDVDRLAAWQRETFKYNRDGGIGIDVKPMQADIVGHVATILFALLGAVGFVLLIACANVASLLLVRAASREKEIAIRAAVGGGRRRIVRMLLTESFLLAAIGGLTGMLLARWGIDLLLLLRPPSLPRVDAVAMDGRVMLFTAGVTVLAALVFGLVPALQASRTNLHASLKDRGTIAIDRRRRRTRGLLVIAEVALSMVLLVGAGLMFRTLAALEDTDLGIRPENVIAFRVNIGFDRSAMERAMFFAELEESIGALPDVVAVGATSVLPLSGRFWTSPYTTRETEGEGWRTGEADYRFVTPGYFEAMGLTLVEGRLLTRRDNLKELRHVVVDRRLAERAWPVEDPVGQQLRVEVLGQSEPEWVKVVGVVETVLSEGPDEVTRETIYMPHLLQGALPAMNMVVRAGKDPTRVIGGVRGIMAKMDPGVPVAGVRPMQGYVDDALAQARFSAIMIAVFAMVALIMAAVGISGVISSSVRQRRHEIGVHMAFGAPGSQILGLVLRRGLALAAAGVVLGVAVSLALTRVVGSMLAGVTPTDPATFVSVAVLLTIVAAVASLIPAARALRVDPGKALRYE